MLRNRNRLWLMLLAVPLVIGAVLALLNGHRPQALPLDHSPMAPIAVSFDDNLVATNKDGQIDILEIYDRSRRRSTQFRTSSVPGAWVFLPDNRTLVTVGRRDSPFEALSSSVQLWDAATQTDNLDLAQPKRTFGPELAWGNALALSPDTKTLATGGQRAILLWDVATGRVTARLAGAGNAPNALTFSRDGKRLAVSYMRAGVNAACWDVPARKLLWTAQVPPGAGRFDVMSSAISPDAERVVLGSSSGQIAIFDGATGSLLHQGTLPAGDASSSVPLDAARAVAFSPDGKTIVSGGWSEAAAWNAADASVKHLFKGSGPMVFSPDGNLLATGAEVNAKNGVILWKTW